MVMLVRWKDSHQSGWHSLMISEAQISCLVMWTVSLWYMRMSLLLCCSLAHIPVSVEVEYLPCTFPNPKICPFCCSNPSASIGNLKSVLSIYVQSKNFTYWKLKQCLRDFISLVLHKEALNISGLIHEKPCVDLDVKWRGSKSLRCVLRHSDIHDWIYKIS